MRKYSRLAVVHRVTFELTRTDVSAAVRAWDLLDGSLNSVRSGSKIGQVESEFQHTAVHMASIHVHLWRVPHGSCHLGGSQKHGPGTLKASARPLPMALQRSVSKQEASMRQVRLDSR